MENEVMNIEDMDFTPEDLENAGVELNTPSAEDTETPATDEPSTTDAGSTDATATGESDTTSNIEEAPAEDEHKHDGNLRKNVQDVKRRKNVLDNLSSNKDRYHYRIMKYQISAILCAVKRWSVST